MLQILFHVYFSFIMYYLVLAKNRNPGMNIQAS